MRLVNLTERRRDGYTLSQRHAEGQHKKNCESLIVFLLVLNKVFQHLRHLRSSSLPLGA